MARRRYRMDKRAEALEETRRRILEATMSVHDEQGMVDASWEEIARRAGVSLSTIYRHFTSNDELVDACGRLTFEEFPPPGEGDRRPESEDPTERVRWLIDEVCGYWETTHPMMTLVRRDIHRSESVARGADRIFTGVDNAIALALGNVGEDTRKTVRALLDDRTWTALVDAGLTSREAKSKLQRLVSEEVERGLEAP